MLFNNTIFIEKNMNIHTIFENLVFIIPGAMQLTLIPSDTRLVEAICVSPNKAVLLMAYAPNNFNINFHMYFYMNK